MAAVEFFAALVTLGAVGHVTSGEEECENMLKLVEPERIFWLFQFHMANSYNDEEKWNKNQKFEPPE